MFKIKNDLIFIPKNKIAVVYSIHMSILFLKNTHYESSSFCFIFHIFNVNSMYVLEICLIEENKLSS